MQKINRKTVGLYCEFFSGILQTQIRFLGALCFCLILGCATIKEPAKTANGQIIPPKGLLSFVEYEYICEPTLGLDHINLEKLLDRYGREGWILGGFLQKEGNTYAFCMRR